MALPIIIKTGAVSGPSIGGQGSNDLVAGERVDLVDAEAANSGASYLWEMEDEPLGTSPTIIDPATATPHFFVDADASFAGSYRVKATVNGVEFSSEIFAKPLTNTGGRIPSYQEQQEYDEGGNAKGWHEAQTGSMRAVDAALGDAQSSNTERQAAAVVPLGNSTKVLDLGGIIDPGSALAISGRLIGGVTAGTIDIRLKINGVTKLTATLNVGSPTFSSAVAAAGTHPTLSADLITVEVEGTSYANAGAVPAELAITLSLSNSLSNSPLSIPDASNTTKGATKLSVAAAVANQPVAAGTNDTRIPSQDENDAMVGTSGAPATGNPYVTNADSRLSDARAPTGHALGGAAHTADTLANLNSKVSDATLIDTADSRLSDARAPSGAAGGDLGGTYPNPTVDDGADGTAIHDNVASEISALTLVTALAGDHILIEDASDANNKKRVAASDFIGATGLPPGYLDGLETSWTSVTTVAIAPGDARDSTNVHNIDPAGTVSAVITTAGVGGLDTGSEAASTWYALYIIDDTTNANAPAALLSASFSSPTMPAGYDVFRRVGAVLNDSSSNLDKFYSRGSGRSRKFWFDNFDGGTHAAVLTAGTATTDTAVVCSAFAPPSARNLIIRWDLLASSGTYLFLLKYPGSTSNQLLVRNGVAVSPASIGRHEIICNTSQNIEYRVSNVAASLTLWVMGWEDEL